MPAANLVVCNRVHPYSFTVFLLCHVRSVNTCAKREGCRYKLQCACLTDCSQIYNHRCVVAEQVVLCLFHKVVFSMVNILLLYSKIFIQPSLIK